MLRRPGCRSVRDRPVTAGGEGCSGGTRRSRSAQEGGREGGGGFVDSVDVIRTFFASTLEAESASSLAYKLRSCAIALALRRFCARCIQNLWLLVS